MKNHIMATIKLALSFFGMIIIIFYISLPQMD